MFDVFFRNLKDLADDERDTDPRP
ncbi:hypothetical protein HALO156_130080 [Halomonas sp. 156]|nr:hypothetical protein HALO156_130080 [Halomonas sp. 156]